MDFSPFSRDLIWLGVRDWKSACSPSSLDLSALIFQKDDSSSGLRPSLTDTFTNTMIHLIYNLKNIQIKTTAVGSFSYLGSWCTLAELAGMRSLYSLWVCLRGWDSLVCRAWCQAEIQLALKEGAKCIFNDPQVHWGRDFYHAVALC